MSNENQDQTPIAVPIDKQEKAKLPACGCTDGEQCDGSCLVPKWIAERVLKARDAFLKKDYDEVYHQLYSIADPEFEKYEPWKDLEETVKTEPTEQNNPHFHTDEKKDCEICGIRFPHFHPDKNYQRIINSDMSEQTPKPQEDKQEGKPERTFTLKEALEIFVAGSQYSLDQFDTPNRQQYFKETFNIDL